jgi:hypothetical protein
MIYHVLNRANFRSRLFRETAHYEDFLGIVEESLRQLCDTCLSPPFVYESLASVFHFRQ